MRRNAALMRWLIALALLGAPVASAGAGDWGPPAGKFRCGLRVPKQIFVQGEQIYLTFSIEPLDPAMRNVERLIPERKPGLIEGLIIVGPDGRLLPLRAKPRTPPAGRFSTVFDVSRYYDFAKPGLYQVTAEYPLESLKPLVLKSQRVSLLVVPRDFIIVGLKVHKSRLRPRDSIPVTINLSTGTGKTVEVEQPALQFLLQGTPTATFWLQRMFPARMTLTAKPRSYRLDLSARVWRRYRSMHRAYRVYDLVQRGSRARLVARLRGRVNGKKFVLDSEPVTLQFLAAK